MGKFLKYKYVYTLTVWKLKNFSPMVFSQKFRQSNFFIKELYCKLISRIFFEMGVNYRRYHTVQ